MRGELTAGEAANRANALLQAPVRTTALPDLSAAAMELSLAIGATVYDSLYIVLAQRLNATFVTGDQRLVRTAKAASIPPGLVHFVGAGPLE